MMQQSTGHDPPQGVQALPVQQDQNAPRGSSIYRDAQSDGQGLGVRQPTNDDRNGKDDAQSAPSSDTSASPPSGTNFLAKLGLDVPTLVIMLKGSLPPVIGIAIYQSSSVSSLLGSIGYLAPIISVLSLAILPRGKFIQTLVLNTIAACIGSAVALLVLWSAIQARLHTSNPADVAASIKATGRPPYNSSQSAVCAVWLFANIWFVNVLRAKMPTLNVPVMLYSILTSVSTTFGPSMASVAQAETFMKQLLTTVLLGLALATAVSLIVVPISSRQVVFSEMKATIGLFRKVVALEKEYLQGLERDDMFELEARPVSPSLPEQSGSSGDPKRPQRKAEPDVPMTKEQKAALALRDTISQLRTLAGKMHGDVKFAKRDIAWGKLDGHDIGELFTLLRNILIPLAGISTILDIFKRIAEVRGWVTNPDTPLDVVAEKNEEKRVWNEVMKQLHEPFEILSQALDQGLEHAAITLEILPRPKSQVSKSAKDDVDVEARGDRCQPGDQNFTTVVEDRMRKFCSRKGEILQAWAREKGLSGGGKVERLDKDSAIPIEHRHREQAQLFIILYLEQLMQAAGEAVQDLAAFADRKAEDGTMKKNRIILPSRRRLRKWLASVLRDEDSTADESPDSLERGANVVYMGDSYGGKKDPEHLPATNAWQRFGNLLRKIPAFFGSEESSFGFRVACATMTVGIIGFLEHTQQFFLRERLVWAMIIIAIGMTQTSGQSIFGFLCRVGGTAIAMVLTFVCWYIVDQKTAGVIVFLWLSLFIGYYFFIKFPRFTPAVMICLVTQVMILGYELQVQQIGAVAAQQSGQPYYPTYKLAPYRLATVSAGCLVAFFWTVFPRPLTDRTWIRRDLSATMYLLANFFSVINTTLRAVVSDTGGDIELRSSPAYHLRKVRQKIYGKLTLLLPSLQAHADWQKWEPDIGGKFPREIYTEIISSSTRIMSYLTLMSYTLTWVPHDQQDPPDTAWLRAFGEVIKDITPVHHTILSTLTLLSNSLLSGQSLPPFMPLPRPYELTRQLLSNAESQPRSSWPAVGPATSAAIDGGIFTAGGASILDARNMDERGYSEFAVLQVCSTLVVSDLEHLVDAVSSLVGVVDFSFRVGGADSSGSLSDSTTSSKERKGKGKTD